VSTGPVRRGVVAGLWAVALLSVSAFPSRLSGALKGWGSFGTKVERTLAGTLLDLGAAVGWLAPMVALVAVLVPWLSTRARGPRWQRLGGLIAAVPVGFGLWVLTVMAQLVKSERGSFPTVFDLAEGGTNASFVGGTLGYLGYEGVWQPLLVGLGLLALLVFAASRQPWSDVVPWKGWSLGLVLGLGAGTVAAMTVSRGLSTFNRFSPAALGDPLTGLIESALDLAQQKGPATARALVLDAQLPEGSAEKGATLLGWPSLDGGCRAVRPLDRDHEPRTIDPRGSALVDSFERLSAQLFDGQDAGVAVFVLSLEGFRADDLHALNPQAPRELAPFTSSLYEASARGDEGVLTSPLMLQAGVRTAHNLGAMLCGVGTLPYNLAFIRDLQPFPLRCAPDVLAEAGFQHRFFYGSDGTFDEMQRFFTEHHFVEVAAQAELPKNLPKGTWDGVTDFAVFDHAVARVAAELPHGPQVTLVMSLSNHSPFTPPEDLPAAVSQRVHEALKVVTNRADVDDERRLVAFSYTDAAVERLFARLDETGLSERSIVVLMADHSTGHAYVWGEGGVETDRQKAQVPFAVVIPSAFLKRLGKSPQLGQALLEARALLEAGALSLNDVPTLVLALLSAHPTVKALPQSARWHSLGGQVTSPYFSAGDGASVLGINGVSELFATDALGTRVGDTEDSVFLKTRADRYRVTPRLIPVTATLRGLLRCADQPQ